MGSTKRKDSQENLVGLRFSIHGETNLDGLRIELIQFAARDPNQELRMIFGSISCLLCFEQNEVFGRTVRQRP